MSISSGFESRREQTRKKVFDRYLSLPFWTGGNHGCAEREHRGRMIICRVAVGQIPADGRLAPHEGIGYHFRRVGEDREF